MPTTDPDSAGDEAAGVPRWVKVFALVVAVLAAAVVIVALAAGGHGPGRHTLSEPAAAEDALAR